jgi:hypothetical protein
MVGRVAALAAAIVGAVMFDGGVRSDVNRPSEATTSVAPSLLARRLHPLFNERVNLDTVATGFQTSEDFAATVHASRNIRVPFTLLKHEIVDEGKTLRRDSDRKAHRKYFPRSGPRALGSTGRSGDD